MFKSYIEATQIVEDIAFDYNYTLNDQFVNTKYDVCKIHNITMSTFNRLQYNYPDLFRSHAYFRGETKYNTIEQLKEQDIDAIAAMYNYEILGKRVNSNELICEKYTICIHTLYTLIRKYPDKFIKKKHTIIYKENKYKCNVCGKWLEKNLFVKDKNCKHGIRYTCRICYNKQKYERRLKDALCKIKKQD